MKALIWIILTSTLFGLGLMVSACGAAETRATPENSSEGSAETIPEGHAKATFAGGCFWCMEKPFDDLKGVHSTLSGYIGGDVKNPTYQQVSRGGTGHTEAVQVVYDPAKVTFQELLDVFWHNIDPLAVNRQFCDSGSQYRSGIFYHDASQQELAEASKQALVSSQRFSEPIATEVTAVDVFYPAEDYHQDYYKKNPVRYKIYRNGCGRDHRLQQLWGDDAPKH